MSQKKSKWTLNICKVIGNQENANSDLNKRLLSPTK